MYEAVRRGDCGTVELLLRKCPALRDEPCGQQHGRTPAMAACLALQPDVLEQLLRGPGAVAMAKAYQVGHRRPALPLIHFITDLRRESVPRFLKRQCGRTLYQEIEALVKQCAVASRERLQRARQPRICVPEHQTDRESTIRPTRDTNQNREPMKLAM